MNELQNKIITKIILIIDEYYHDEDYMDVYLTINKFKSTMNKIDNINKMNVYELSCNYLVKSQDIIIYITQDNWFGFDYNTMNYNFVNDLHGYSCPEADGETIFSIYNRHPKSAMNLYVLPIGG